MDRERRAAARAFAANPLDPELARLLARAHARDGTPVPGWVTAAFVEPARALQVPGRAHVQLLPPDPHPALPPGWLGRGPWWRLLGPGEPVLLPAHRAWFLNPLNDVDANLAALGALPGPVGVQTHTPGWGERLAALPGLRWLDLQNRAAATAELLETLEHVGDRLERLVVLKAPGLGQRGLEALRACPHLGSLELAGLSRMRDTDLAVLSELSELSELSIEESGSLRGPGLAALAALPHLRRLQLRHCRRLESRALPTLPQLLELGLPLEQSPDYAAVARQPRLQALSCGGTGVGLAALRGPPLQRLELGDVSNAGLDEACQHPSLTGLTLRGGQLDDAGLAPLRRLPSLRSLRLLGGDTRRRWGPAACEHLAALTGLEELELESWLPAPGLPGLLALPRLKRLQLRGVEGSLPLPAGPSRLERLELGRWAGLDGATLRGLVAAAPGLRSLWLPREHQLVPGDLRALLALSRLEELDVHAGALPAEALDELAEHPALARLHAVGERLRPRASASLQRLPRLELAEIGNSLSREWAQLRPDGSTAAR